MPLRNILNIFPRRMTAKDAKAMKNGFRKYFAPNGDTYTGFWKNDKKHGWGLQVWKKTGNTYNGEWISGKSDGYGSYSVWDKDKQEHRLQYEGQWKGGHKHGYGAYYYNSGDIYEGEWCENQRDGKGVLQFANGGSYHGEWKKGKRNGKGIVQYSNGDLYDGEWKDGLEHGFGILFYVDQLKYWKGQFEKGKVAQGEMVTCTEDNFPLKESDLEDINWPKDVVQNPRVDWRKFIPQCDEEAQTHTEESESRETIVERVSPKGSPKQQVDTTE